MLHESVVLRVAYERKGTKWKEFTDTVTQIIAKDSSYIYIYIGTVMKMLFLSLKALTKFVACQLLQ